MFAGNIGAGDELGDGITSSMSILYDLDAAEQGPGTENVNSWDWNSNLSTTSSNYSTGQQMYEGVNTDKSDGSQKMAYQDPWNESYANVSQMNDQNGYNQYSTQNYNSSYNDSSKQVGQMQSPYDNYGSNYSPNYNQQGRNSLLLNAPYPPQSLARGTNNLYQQRGLHQKIVHQSFGATSSGANYKILPSKRFSMGNFVARDHFHLGQRGVLGNGFLRKGIVGTFQGQQAPLMKNKLGAFGHGLIKIVNDNTSNANKHTPLVFHDPPYQRQKPLPEQPPTLDYAGNGRGHDNDSEKPFSPTAIELVSATADDDNCSTHSSPRVIEVTTVPIRNTIFGYKKLKFRCMRCGNRDATFNSQLTHVKSHRKPYCMQCCWIGSHALQLKAHIEKAHPRIDAGSGTTMVTSKYGRKCQVNTSVAVGLKRKRISAKSPEKSASIAEEEKPEPCENRVRMIKAEPLEKFEEPENVDTDWCPPSPKKVGLKRKKILTKSPQKSIPAAAKEGKPEPYGNQIRDQVLNQVRMVKTEPIEKVEEPDEPENVDAEWCSPSPIKGHAKGSDLSEAKEAAKMTTPPTRELSKRRLALMAKYAQKEEGMTPPKVESVLKAEETTPLKGDIFPKSDLTPFAKGKIVSKGGDTSPLKRDIFSKGEVTPLGKGNIVSKEGETPPSKGKIAPAQVREMPKRGLRKK